MPEKVKINEIANRCGVSMATVSLVLNDKPGISASTRQHVIKTAREMGYPVGQPSPVIHPKKLNTLGLIVKSEPGLLPPSNPFYSRIIAGVDEACKDLGLNLLFSMLPVDENNRPERIPPFLESNMADGFLMVGTFVDETISSVLGRWTVPIVLVDGYSDTERYDMVVSDNFRAAYQAVEYMINLGHQHIGLVGGELDCYPSLRERRNGYLRAIKENGLSDTYLANFNICKTQGEEQTIRLLRENPQITALFAINDNIAVGVIQAIHSMGMRVPEDISVIGYDDTLLATSVSPTLTTMHVDTVAMGQGAAHLVSLRIHRPEAARLTLVVHPTLVERSSVTTPRKT